METFEAQLRARQAQVSGPFEKLCAKAWNRFCLPTSKTGGYRYVKLRELYATSCAWNEAPFQFSCEGAEVLGLDEAIRSYSTYLRGRWNFLLKTERDPLAHLNAALFTSGLFVYVPPACEATMQLTLPAGPGLSLPRIHIFVGGGARLSLHMEGSGEVACVNGLLDLLLEEGACVALRINNQPHQDTWLSQAVRATLKQNARLELSHTTDGARCVRLDADVALVGEDAEADLRGAWILNEKRQAHTQIRIAHAAPNTRSRQLFKGVLAGGAKSSFSGMIDVASVAQRTDAFQLNKNLLLSDYASAYTRPELQVRADDVKASHGATVGRLDSEEQFYLASRGLSEAQVRRLLVSGFVSDIAGAGRMVNSVCSCN